MRGVLTFTAIAACRPAESLATSESPRKMRNDDLLTHREQQLPKTLPMQLYPLEPPQVASVLTSPGLVDVQEPKINWHPALQYDGDFPHYLKRLISSTLISL